VEEIIEDKKNMYKDLTEEDIKKKVGKID